MSRFNHILFPVDFSDRAAHAVPFVETMANRFQARITLLSVAHPIYSGGLAEGAIIDPQELLRSVTSDLDSAYPNAFQNIKVDRVALLGDPARIITDFADTHDVDLIMMPTHGYGPFRQLLLGSVTSKVLHDSKKPVWTTAHHGDLPDKAHLAMAKVMCAVDGSPESLPLMRCADSIAKDLNASLRFVHVVPGIEAWPERQMDLELEEQLRETAKTGIEGMAASAGIDAPVCIAVGGIADAVADEAERHGADLVIIGRGALQATLGRLRTHAYGIIRLSPCPVLSL
jgi:nucleotide-binding universal stress UspA family protein